MIAEDAFDDVDEDVDLSPVIWDDDVGEEIGWDVLLRGIGLEEVIGVWDCA